MTRRFNDSINMSVACLFFAAFTAISFQGAIADQHTGGVPSLSSRPGADYTIYLNVAGFNYDGLWRGNASAPGSTPAVGDVAFNANFNAAQQTAIKNIWSRAAQSYIGFNVNVTTIDPAIAAGQASTDSLRQSYYDASPNLMHTIVGSQLRDDGMGGMVKWYSDSADGVSGLDVVAGITGAPGDHTNWMFTEDQQGVGFINGDYIGAIASHENAHAFGLYHQGDWTGPVKINEYSNGDAVPGIGTYVPIIGNASDRQRVTWRLGDTGGPNDVRTVVNDVQSMLAINSVLNGRTGTKNLHLIDDGIGHSRLTSTPLPLTGNLVNPSLAQGVIVPLSEFNPNPIGANNYTEDWFSFTTNGLNPITLTATDGTSFLSPGVADGVGTLRSVLSIYDSLGAFIATGLEDSSTLFETYTNTLLAGTYYAQIASFGGHAQVSPMFNDASYFDMGGFFLTGSGFAPVPEPGTFCILVICGVFLLRRRNSEA